MLLSSSRPAPIQCLGAAELRQLLFPYHDSRKPWFKIQIAMPPPESSPDPRSVSVAARPSLALVCTAWRLHPPPAPIADDSPPLKRGSCNSCMSPRSSSPGGLTTHHMSGRIPCGRASSRTGPRPNKRSATPHQTAPRPLERGTAPRRALTFPSKLMMPLYFLLSIRLHTTCTPCLPN